MLVGLFLGYVYINNGVLQKGFVKNNKCDDVMVYRML